MDRAITLLVVGIIAGLAAGAAIGYGMTSGGMGSLQAQVAALQSQNSQLDSQLASLQANWSQLDSQFRALQSNQTQLLALSQALVDENIALRQQLNASILPQCLYFFTSDGCHSCEVADAYITQVETQYPGLAVHRYEVHNITNWNLMVSLYQAHGMTFYSTPVAFIGNEVLMGYADIAERLVPLVLNNTGLECPSSS